MPAASIMTEAAWARVRDNPV